MKGKKQRQKVIPHCYRRKLSRTLSNSSVSQLVQIGSYKKRINDLSRNNRHLASALQDARVESAIQNNILKDCAKDCNKILFARLKLNEMAKNIAKFVSDLEEVRSYLNVEMLSEANPFTQKKGSTGDRICKDPPINCIEEVTEESLVHELAVAEDAPSVPDFTASRKSDKTSAVLRRTSTKNVGFLNEEDLDIAPILFAEDAEEKKKKNSNKSRSSKMLPDPDKASLTPELNTDLTCIKLKRNSSRRLTQFLFPGSRSTSRGKNASSAKENSPEELVTPVKPPSPPLANYKQNATERKKTIEEIFKSPVNNVEDSKSEKLKNDTVIHPKPSNVSIMNTVVVPGVHSGESNHTVLLCEDMELTEVIRPVHQIILENYSHFTTKSLDDLNPEMVKESKENDAFSGETENNDNSDRVTTKEGSPSLFSIHANTPEKLCDDDVQLPKINEQDEVQNVGNITFCEPNVRDVNRANKKIKSPLVRQSHRAKLMNYAVYFSSDESEDDSSLEIFKQKINNRKSVVINKIAKSCEKKEGTDKVSLEIQNETKKENILNCTVDALHLGKEGNKLSKRPKDAKGKSKNDLPKQSSQKCSAVSKDEDFKHKRKENVKKLVPNKKDKKLMHNSEIVKNSTLSHESVNHENTKTSKVNPEALKKSSLNHETVKMSELNQETVNRTVLNHEKTNFSNVNQQNTETTSENSKKLVHSPGSILKNTQFHLQTKNKENESPLKEILFSDDTLTNEIESPKSESRKVSFAPTDLICKFRKMSVSKKIADNKKVRRTSKSVLDPEELLEEEANKSISHLGADNFSESTNNIKVNKPVFDFSDDTELYTFQLPSNPFFSSVPTTDDLLRPNVTKKNPKQREKVIAASKPVKTTGKLSLKNSKNPKKSQSQLTSAEILKEKNVLPFESPISVCKSAKRKSLFKEDLEDSKENINLDHQILEKNENVSKGKNQDYISMNPEISVLSNCFKKSTTTKSHSKSQGKKSMKKLSDKPRLLEPEIKKKKSSSAVRRNESVPVLKDTINLPEVEDGITSKRRSKQISYKEPSLHKKLRRE